MRIELRNLNLLFNKEYYRKLGTKDFAADVVQHNKDILSAAFRYKDDYRKSPIASHTILLETCYPGLLIGAGNPHGVSKAVREYKGKKDDPDEDVSLGFSFDYVTGQPYIPGSSVKGVLRSHFKYYKGRINAVEEILRTDYPGITDEVVGHLEKAIFENKEVVGDSEKAIFENKEVVGDLEKAIFENADVFLDAVVFDGDEYGSLMGFDFITPHSSQTANPTPIRIVKVLPGVRFQFRFRLSDKKVDGMKFKAGDILRLFEILLTQFGAGAKTNVGYGIFTKLPDNTPHRKITVKKADTPESGAAASPVKESKGSKPPRIKCPHCKKLSFVYYKDSTDKRKTCSLCHKSLYT